MLRQLTHLTIDELRDMRRPTWLDEIAGRPGTLRGSLSRGAVGIFSLKLGHALMMLAISVVLARILAPKGYGIYTFALSVVTLLGTPARMGIPTLIVRQTARYQEARQWGILRALLQWSDRAVLGVAMLVAAGVAAVILALQGRVGTIQRETLLWAVLLLPLLSAIQVRGSTLQGLRHVVKSQLPEMLVLPGLFLLLLSVVAFSVELTAPLAMGLYCAAALVSLIVGGRLLGRALPESVFMQPPQYDSAAWLRAILPLSLLSGIQMINSQTDIVMLGLLTREEDVGLYQVAVSGARLVTFTLAAVGTVIAPHIARLHQAGDLENLQRLVTQSARVILAAALLVAGAFLVAGEQIIHWVFGEAYRPAAGALAILCVGQLISAGMGCVGLLLNMTGHEKETLFGMAVAAAANIVLNISLIPHFGIRGAATATAISLGVWNVLLHRAVWKRLGIRSTAFSLRYS